MPLTLIVCFSFVFARISSHSSNYPMKDAYNKIWYRDYSSHSMLLPKWISMLLYGCIYNRDIALRCIIWQVISNAFLIVTIIVYALNIQINQWIDIVATYFLVAIAVMYFIIYLIESTSYERKKLLYLNSYRNKCWRSLDTNIVLDFQSMSGELKTDNKLISQLKIVAISSPESIYIIDQSGDIIFNGNVYYEKDQMELRYILDGHSLSQSKDKIKVITFLEEKL